MDKLVKTHIEVTSDKIKGFTELPLEGAFQMINLLKFKEQVENTEMTGSQVYAQYLQAVMPFFKQSKAKIIYHGKPHFNIIGPDERLEWDKILIIEYASKQEFINMVTSEGYPEDLRNRALEDSRLIVSVSK